MIEIMLRGGRAHNRTELDMGRKSLSAALNTEFKLSAGNAVAGKAVKEIRKRQFALFESYKDLLESLDPSDKTNWPTLISAALQAGLTEEELLLETGASQSTLHRWINDGIAPREGTRKLIKRALLELVNDKLDDYKLQNEPSKSPMKGAKPQ
jgi:hypothetical protein